jgi:arylsulfatase A-like enzyme
MASSAAPDIVVIVIDDVGWRDIGSHDGPVATRRRGLQQSMTRQMPGEELTGYS